MTVGGVATWLAGAAGSRFEHAGAQGVTCDIVGYWSLGQTPRLRVVPSSGLPGVTRSAAVTPSAAITASHSAPSMLPETCRLATPGPPGAACRLAGA